MLSDWKLTDFFQDYDRLLIALDGEELSNLINDPLLDNQLSSRQRYKFSATSATADFIRFLEATRSVALIEAVVLYFAKDLHGRNLLRQDNALVKRLMFESNPELIVNPVCSSDPSTHLVCALPQEQRRNLESAGIQMVDSKPKLTRAEDAIAKQTGRNQGNSRINLNDYISDRDKLLSILDEGLLDSIVHHRSFDRLITDRQRLQFSRPGQDSGTRFLRFIDAMQSVALLNAFIGQLASDPIGQEVLNMGNLLVKQIGCDISAGNLLESGQRIVPDRLTSIATVEGKTTPMIKSANPNNYALPATLDFQTNFMSMPQASTTSSATLVSNPFRVEEAPKELTEFPILPYIPKIPYIESPELFVVIKDVEIGGARMILTRTHTLYYESSSSCFLGFNIIFQPSEARITKAQITLQFPPLASGQQPKIIDIHPNSSQQWPTGPPATVIASKGKAIRLTVGNALYSSAGAVVESAHHVESASTSILTAAGVATPKLTIVLKESQAGDGIIYNFSFGVTLDLISQEKPSFLMQLALSWQLARSWFPSTRPLLKQTLSFDPSSQLDGPAPHKTSH